MKKNLAIILLFIPFVILRPQDLTERYSDLGKIVITHLHASPFPDTARVKGYTYNNKFYSAEDHYSDSTVAVFIPNGYKQKSTVDLVIHFHGWFNNVDSTFGHYNLARQFAESGKNALLVIPAGAKDVPDSYGGKLEDSGGFKRFVEELIDTLFARKVVSTERIGRIILSGHSGGYRVMSFILMRGGLTGHIKEVYLFDALYAEQEKFVYWFDHYKGKLIDIYTKNGGTKENSEKIVADLKGWRIPYISFDSEQSVTPFKLANNRLIFIYTDLQHNDVLSARNEFEEFLKASCLTNIN